MATTPPAAHRESALVLAYLRALAMSASRAAPLPLDAGDAAMLRRAAEVMQRLMAERQEARP